MTDTGGAIVISVELDPWGADTVRSSNAAFQPRRFTTYERDANGGEEAMFRRYHRGRAAFDQPDPYDGSYDFTDPPRRQHRHLRSVIELLRRLPSL